MSRTLIISIALASLTAIGVGCWMAYPPLGLIVPGALVWLDMATTRLKEEVPHGRSR